MGMRVVAAVAVLLAASRAPMLAGAVLVAGRSSAGLPGLEVRQEMTAVGLILLGPFWPLLFCHYALDDPQAALMVHQPGEDDRAA